MPERTPSEPVRLEVENLNDLIENRSAADPQHLSRLAEALEMSEKDVHAFLGHPLFGPVLHKLLKAFSG